MRKWGLAFIVVACACWGTPAAVADDGTVAISDPCGDMHGGVRYNDQRVDLPPTPRTARFDLQNVALSSTATGVRATFTSCAAIGENDGLAGLRTVSAYLGGHCYVGFTVLDGVDATKPRQATFEKHCYGDDPGPLNNGMLVDNDDERFSIAVPLTVNGATMSLEISRAGLTGEAAALLAPGATWTYPSAGAIETATLWGGGFGTDDQGHTDYYNYQGPSGVDWTNVGPAFVVR